MTPEHWGVAVLAIGWLSLVAFLLWLASKARVLISRDRCPECGRFMAATDEIHFDGARYRHSFCSFNRGVK